MFTRLVSECLDRTGRGVMAASIALGVVAGLGVAQVVRLTPDVIANIGVWILIGGAVGFFLDLLFISPIRLWQKTEIALGAANEEIRALRNAPPIGMQIGQIATQVVVQMSGGVLNLTASSDYIILGQDQEGILFPRGTLFRGDVIDHLGFIQEGVRAAVTQGGDFSFVPPELLDKPP